MLEPLVASCDLTCALVNQSVLYIATLVAPIAVIAMVMKIFSDLQLQGFIMLLAIVFVMWACSFFGLVPFYISGIVTAVAVFTQLQNRLSRRPT